MPSGRAAPSVDPFLAAASAGSARRVLTEVTTDHQARGLTAFEGTPQPGQAIVSLPPAPADGAFLVEIVALSSTSTNACTADVFVGDTSSVGLVDHSGTANEDIAFEQPPILVPAGQQLFVVWSGLSAGAAVAARIQWRVVTYVPVAYGAAG